MKVIHFLQNNCDLTAFAEYIEGCNFALKTSVNMPLEYVGVYIIGSRSI